MVGINRFSKHFRLDMANRSNREPYRKDKAPFNSNTDPIIVDWEGTLLAGPRIHLGNKHCSPA